MEPDKTLMREVLENSLVFKNITPAGKKELLDLGQLLEFPAGYDLVQEGTEGDCFYVVLSGRVRITSMRDEKPIVLAELGRGAILGEVALLTGEHRTATITAMVPTSVVRFSEPQINDILSRYPKLKEILVRLLVHRAKDTIDKMLQDRTVS